MPILCANPGISLVKGLRPLLNCYVLGGALSLVQLAAVSAASLDQLLLLAEDGQSYTSQFTIEAGAEALEISLPGSVVPDMVKILGDTERPAASNPEQQNSPAANEATNVLTLSESVLLLRYEHQYNAEISITLDKLASSEPGQDESTLDRVFKLSIPAVTLVKDPDKLDSISIVWIFPPGFTVNHWHSDDKDAHWTLNNNRLQFESNAEETPAITISYTQPAASRADLDLDGIPDDIDDCPSTKNNVLVNKQGCALDFDKDGVPNSFDQCADTPAGIAVDANGCQPDEDRDGIPDSSDQCAATPRVAVTDAIGCAIDTDADSVPDYRDTCPVQQFVKRIDGTDWWGCQVTGPIQLAEISFKTGSSNLDENARNILDKIALAMNFHSSSRFEVAAHTDWLGTPKNNKALSERRASVVRRYLLLKGVQPHRLVAKGFGETRPIASNETLYGRQRNRRIEVVKLPD